jgi:hypothetical protein
MHRRLIAPAVAAALSALAIGPAAALAAPGSFADDAAADFGAGAAQPTLTVGDQITLKQGLITEPFNAGLPSTLVATPGTAASVSAGVLTVDGGNVQDTRSFGTNQVLEFRAAFSTDRFESIGFATDLDHGPWALFSTGGLGDNFRVTTRSVADATPVATDVAPAGFDPTQMNNYRIEWVGNTVKYFINDIDLAVPGTVDATSQMHAAITDLTAGSGAVSVDSLGQSPLYNSQGSFESRVFDAGGTNVTWGALTGAFTATGPTTIAFETRTGQTPNAGDATWSAYQPLGTGAAIVSPKARYIQYRATLATSDNRVTPSVDRVAIGYDLDTSTGGSTSGGGTTGGTQGSGTSTAVDKTKPKVTFVAKSLRASKKGTVSFTVGCPKTEKSCAVKVSLKNGKKTVASKLVTIKGGKTKTVTLTLNSAARKLLAKRHSLKLSSVVSATDAAGNRKTTTKQLTLRRAAG